MSFTKSNYEDAARIIAQGRAYTIAYPHGQGDADQYIRGYRQALSRVQDGMLTMFAADNPRFDAERFAKACEPGSGK